MSKFRKLGRWTSIPNELIMSTDLRFSSKAVYCYLACRPDGWKFNVLEIIRNFKEGRDAIISAIRELEDFGWLMRNRVNDDEGRFTYEYILNEKSEKPIDIVYETGLKLSDLPYTDKPHMDKPHTDKPHTEKPTYNNTECSNTECSNTECSNTEIIATVGNSHISSLKNYPNIYKILIKSKIDEMEEKDMEIISYLKDSLEYFLKYRKEARKTVKSRVGLVHIARKLNKLCKGNVELSRAIVVQSIENNWQGVFELQGGKAGTRNGDISLLANMSNRLNDSEDRYGGEAIKQFKR